MVVTVKLEALKIYEARGRWYVYPRGGGVALITWHTASGDVYEQETASRQEAKDLLSKIQSSDQLSLVSAQVRRVGIGPDS